MLLTRLQISSWVFAVALSILPAAARAAETYSLTHKARLGDSTRVKLEMHVGGNLRLTKDGKSRDLPMAVEAKLTYDEQITSLGAAKSPWRSLRHYSQAEAEIGVEKGGVKPSLSTERRLIGVESLDGVSTLFSPSGPLTREELDLVDIPGNTLLIDEMLPSEPVAIGGSWKHADSLLTAILGLDAVSFTDAQSVLGEVADGKARIAMAGAVQGAIGGVSTSIELKAKYEYDLQQKRITWFALLIKEKRAVGHVSPGLDVVAKLILTVTPIAESEQLKAAQASKPITSPTSNLTRLSYAHMSGKWRFMYDRSWYVTSDEKNLAVMRMVDRGELVAQCNISPLPPNGGKPVTLAEFQADIQRSLGANFGSFLNASQATDATGSTVYRVTASGMVSQLPVQWIYYLVASQQGERVTLAFTLESDLVERLGQADKTLVSTVRFVAPGVETARQPTPAVQK